MNRSSNDRGIPTTYNGIRFRSRLEARWARFMDAMGWPWEYEPFDLVGYIPDFVLPFRHGQLLIEVKPAVAFSELLDHKAKIIDAEWGQHFAVVGSCFWSSKGIDSLFFGAGSGVPGFWLFDACPDCGIQPTEIGIRRCLSCGGDVHKMQMAALADADLRGVEVDRFKIYADTGKITAKWAASQNAAQWRG